MHYLGKGQAIAMDDCGGHNKNNNILGLAPHLVEMGFFQNCEFDFYIRGRPKHARDRTFNQMKLQSHKSDVCSYQQFVYFPRKQDNVTIMDATAALFFYYEKYLNKFYNSFKMGTVQNYNVFRCDYFKGDSLDLQDARMNRSRGAAHVKEGRKNRRGASITGVPNSSWTKVDQTCGAVLKKQPYVPRQYWDEHMKF
jgi:hypothetical protein